MPISTNLRLAGAAFVAAALVFVGVEALAAHAFTPAYDYTVNFISELGIDGGCWKDMHGATACSPLADWMNAAFMADGALFILAAALVFPRLTRPSRFPFLALALVYGVGLIMVGLNHASGSGPQAQAGKTPWHVIGATMAIVGGNIAIAISPIARDLSRPAWLLRAGPGLMVLGLACLLVLLVEAARHSMILFGPGFWERGSVYTIVAWQLLTGGCLLVARVSRGAAD